MHALRALVLALSSLCAASASAQQSVDLPMRTRAEREAGDLKLPVTSTSPFAAPEANDARFMVDRGGGLDTGCTFKSSGPLVIQFDVTRHVGDVAKLKAAGLIGETAKLLMPAYDVDYASGERDEVYLNNHLVNETYLTGSNDTWKLNVFDVPIEWIEFPSDPGPGGTLTPQPNTIRIQIDVATVGDTWCTAIDWVALEIEVARPVIMAHGILSDGGVWNTVWVPGLNALGLPNSNALNMGNLDSIQNNAGKIGAEVAKAKDRWGTKKVILVCHSKGGLDSRHYAETNDDVDKVIQIGTPNAGSPLADAVQMGSLKLTGLLATVIINLLAGPAGVQLTTPYMAIYNATHGSNAKTEYVALAGDYDPDCFFLFSFQCALYQALLLITGRGDTIVPVSSVHALAYTQNMTYASSGLGDQSATHTELEKSQNVYNMVIGLIKEKKGPQDVSLEAPDEPAQMTVTEANAISQGQSQMFTFLVDDPGPASFTLLYPSGDLDMAIMSPTGSIYDEASAAGNPELEYGEGAILGGYSESFDFQTTEVGQWTVTVFADSVVEPSGVVGYVATVLLEDSTVELAAGFEEESVQLGDPIVIQGTLTSNGSPLTGAGAQALVVRPDASSTTVTLLDDGLGDDETASDGVYTGTLASTTLAGTYRVAIQATGATYEREAFAVATASASTSSITGPYADAGLDTNADGLFEHLVIDVGLDVTLAGTYRMAGELRDSLGNSLRATAAATLATGPQTVELLFDGETLFENGVNGPYELVRVVLFEEGAIDVLPVAAVLNPHTTSAYDAFEFQHAPIVVPGTGLDFGVDGGGNGLFDELHVDVDVLITVAGTYEWTASLSTESGIDLGFDTGSATFIQGLNTLSFDFPGTPIGASKLNGPYQIRGLLVFGASQSLVQSEAYTTGPYFATEFEGFPNTLPAFGAGQCGQSHVLFMGDSLSLGFSASDPDSGQTLTLSAAGVPAGASLTPSLPISANPASTQLDWTPTPAEEGHHVITFTAADDFSPPGQKTCNLTVDVSTNVAPTFGGVSPCGQVVAATVGEPTTFSVQVSDPNAADTLLLSVTGMPATAVLTPALPAVGNPINVEFTWTPTCADVGTYPLAFNVVDDGDFVLGAQCQVTLDVSLPATTPILYVDALASGLDTGASWANAFPDLESALDEAAQCTLSPEVQIWVAKGTYKPTGTLTGDARTATFVLQDGVALYGGFAGGETLLSQRDPVLNVTVLSGDLQGDDLPGFVNRDDNAYHVLLGDDVGPTAVVDGFTIRGGAADGAFNTNGGGFLLENASPTIARCRIESSLATRGGGLFADATSSPAISECVITGCRADKGGGLVFEGGAASLADCIVSSNQATIDGGGLLLRFGSPGTLSNCDFDGNSANTGGGVALDASSLVASGCEFSGNSAADAGGAVHNVLGSSADLSDCVFTSNSSDRGGAVFTSSGTVVLTSCELTSNDSQVDGGALLNSGAVLTVADCTFDQNDAAALGGAAFSETSGQSTFAGCTFTANTAARGGALASSASTVSVEDCAFTSNASALSGGAMDDRDGNVSVVVDTTFTSNTSAAGAGAHMFASDGSFTGCTFAGNHSTGTGGGLMLLSGSSPAVTNCDFTQNTASTAAALYSSASAPGVTGCTFTLNTATVDGGAVASVSSSNVVFASSVFAQNSSSGLGGALLNTSGSSAVMTNCSFQENQGGSGGAIRNDGPMNVADCTFEDNTASSAGGAFDNRGSASPELVRCSFTTNGAGSGGAVFSTNSGSPAFRGCTFDGNTAGNGAAVFNSSSGAPSFRNCVFKNQSATGSGGAIFQSGTGPALVRNCLMFDNFATSQGGCISIGATGNLLMVASTLASNSAQLGGGIFLAGNVSITSSILWGNQDSSGSGETGQIRQPSGPPPKTGFMDYSIVTGWTGALAGTGNNGLDPLFVNYAGSDFHLTMASPAANTGDPAFTAEPGELDLDGEARVTSFGLDRGSDEAHDCNATGLPDYLEILLGTASDCNDNAVPDSCDLAAGTSTDGNGNNVPDECEVRQLPIGMK